MISSFFSALTSLRQTIDLQVLLILMWGDSVCNGNALISTLSDSDYLTQEGKIYKKTDLSSSNNGAWEILSLGGNNHPGSVESPTGYHGYEASLLKSLTSAFPGKDIRIIKLGWGGSTTGAQSGTNNDWQESELLGIYKNYFIQPAIDKIIAEGKIPVFKGASFSLGINDSKTTTNANAYLTNIRAKISALRTFVGVPELPVVFSQIWGDVVNSGLITQTNYETVSNAQLTLDSDANIYMSSNSGFTFQDHIHPDSDTYILQGQRHAATLIPLL